MTGMAALVATGCLAVLGLNDDKKDAVGELCACVADDLFAGDVALCQRTVDTRLRTAPPTIRQTWLDSFSRSCSRCDATCKAVYLTPPSCTDGADECVVSACSDCCNTTPADTGTCAGSTQ
jgi:hypothetical protein